MRSLLSFNLFFLLQQMEEEDMSNTKTSNPAGFEHINSLNLTRITRKDRVHPPRRSNCTLFCLRV